MLVWRIRTDIHEVQIESEQNCLRHLLGGDRLVIKNRQILVPNGFRIETRASYGRTILDSSGEAQYHYVADEPGWTVI